jgi:hypothetical protein
MYPYATILRLVNGAEVASRQTIFVLPNRGLRAGRDDAFDRAAIA